MCGVGYELIAVVPAPPAACAAEPSLHSTCIASVIWLSVSLSLSIYIYVYIYIYICVY